MAQGENKADIRGVKSVISLPQKFAGLILAIAIILLLTLAGSFLLPFLRKKASEIQTPEIKLTAAEEALQRAQNKAGRYSWVEKKIKYPSDQSATVNCHNEKLW